MLFICLKLQLQRSSCQSSEPVVQVSVWYGCVLRGDLNSIKVGSFSSIQERTVVHAAR